MSGDGRGSGPDGQVEEEDEESSSSSSPLQEESELEDFRRKWRNEVRSRHEGSVEPKETGADGNGSNLEEQEAMRLFMEGVAHEERGEMYEAILKYKKAVHLMPDIEKKAFDVSVMKAKRPSVVDIEKPIINNVMKDDNKTKLENEDEDLVALFSNITLDAKMICEPSSETSITHISCLPIEVLITIMKWVVSDELDLRSLENVSEVCRGFYLMARSSDIWRLICMRTWGMTSIPSGLKSKVKNNDWRRFFLSRPRVHHNGCYLAKMSYMREGERGFTDHQFYRAWHVVQYYRVVRFYPGGKIVMNTTAEEPSQAVKMFSSSNGSGNQGCMVGQYQTFNNRVICVVKKASAEMNNMINSARTYKRSNKRKKSQYLFEVPDQVFHFELEIKGKKHKQLHWINYTVVSRYKSSGREQTTEMDVSNFNNYPPLHYSTVKSFRSETTEAPLDY